MACKDCEKLEDIQDLDRPYVVRACTKCGRKIKLRPSGAHGIGLNISKGDQVVLPATFLKIAANPLKGTGHFSRHGIGWFAEMVFGIDLAKKENNDDVIGAIKKIQEANEFLFQNVGYLKDLDLQDPKNEEELYNRLSAHPKTTEWWGFLGAVFCSMALNAIHDGNAPTAAWAMASAERYRALAIFKENFEEVVFMGHSAKRLLDLIHLWDANKENSDEEFWQITLSGHAYAISQLFSVPVTLIKDKAYVGGMSVEKTDARLLDFMLSGGHSNDAILLEIKTPTTKLLGGRYRRNAYAPSAALGGSIVQVSDYCQSFRENILALTRDMGVEINAFNPKRIVLIGHAAKELTSKEKRASFELFRGTLSGIEIVTFDEFFRKIEQLAKLFNLVRAEKAPEASKAN